MAGSRRGSIQPRLVARSHGRPRVEGGGEAGAPRLEKAPRSFHQVSEAEAVKMIQEWTLWSAGLVLVFLLSKRRTDAAFRIGGQTFG